MLYYKDDFVEIHHGHALEVLKQMPGESVDCVVTSPPYWGLRTYKTEPIIWGDNHCEHEWGEAQSEHHPGQVEQTKWQSAEAAGAGQTAKSGNFCLKCNAWRGELGLEPTIELYIQHLILIFNEVKRVLKKTGTCWVNIDDSYAGSGKASGQSIDQVTPKQASNFASAHINIDSGIAAKSLCLIPQRFALAMVGNGWILRNDIVWNKPNPMPESVKDRFTGSWEHLFFFIKNNQALYWTNSKTFKLTDKQPPGTHGVENEDWEWIEHSSCEGKGCNNKRCVNGKIKSSLWDSHDYWFEQQFEVQSPTTHSKGGNPRTTAEFANQSLQVDGKIAHDKWHEYTSKTWLPQGRNKRDVWTIPTAPYPEAHFATFPERLCETPILAGCPSMICKKCGKAREKIYQVCGHTITEAMRIAGCDKVGYYQGDSGGEPEDYLAQNPSDTKRRILESMSEVKEVAYTDCGCNAGFEPGVTLDPFCGSGAALAAAKKLGRKGIGIDLNPKYCGLTVKRLEEIPLPMF